MVIISKITILWLIFIADNHNIVICNDRFLAKQAISMFPQSQSLIYNTKKEPAKADPSLVEMVETKGIEPSTSRMRTERSPS